MALKVYDGQGRWRNKTVAFRISPEEDEMLEVAVRLSGLTKQDYIIRRLQCRDVVVQGNPRVYKARYYSARKKKLKMPQKTKRSFHFRVE
jgi:hypothetical protein